VDVIPSALRRFLPAVLCAVLTACTSGPSRIDALPHSHPTPEALAEAVLDAVAAGDEAALHDLALSEQEFREYVWPELPASRPERNLPFSYVWGDLRQKSHGSLAETLARDGGTRPALVAVRFGGGVTRYPSYTVHPETILTVRSTDGATRDVRLYGSSFERGGAWKVFSYVTD
jgi:hypothetical protein